MMKVKNILFLVLIVAKIYHMKLICESICNGRNDCIESIPSSIINHTLGVEAQHLCYQNNTCFGVNDTTQIPVQQIPVIAFKDQELVFNIGTLLQPNFTFEILQSATYKHFVLCNSSEGTQLTYSQKTQTLIQLSNLEPGVHYLLFVSNNLLYSCLFGFRIQVTVHDHLCYTDDHTLCSSNGRCLLNATSSIYQCNCCAGYYGQFCEEFNGCSLKPCLNNGTCSDVDSGSMSGVNCSCEAQFTGHYCQSCVSGFTGSKCLTDIDECNKTQNMCNYGVCSNTFGSFICHCPVNVTGALCNIDLYDNCQSNPCGGNSTCVDMDGSFACHCPIGFTGQHCDIDINECINNTCSVEGTDNCVDLIGKYYCQCIPGYTGIDCEVDINECASAPCEHGGLCYDLLHKYSCACQPGYDGENCQNIANKCAIIKPCQNNGTCVRSGHNNRNYTCSCIPGWTGRNCSYEINECFSRPCLNNATCIDLFNTFSCACQLGWTGEMCENNIDMCALSLCENNSTCIDSMIGLDYTCVCIPGFTSRNCSINIDECATYNGSCNYGVCVDLINDFTCQCDQGWFGKHCDTDKDLCSQTPCVNFVSCENVNSTLGYKCVCKPGFTGDNCLTETDSCMNSSCQNGATCNSFLHFYNCTCAPGFEGQFCEHETNECSSNPCLNNGICKDFINQYFCDCPHGFNGSRCEHNINDCFSFPCKNNGSCIDKVNDYSCNCLSGFTSKDCSVHVCTIATTCQNNATCMQTYGGFQCICPPQFTGIRCESSINECLLTPCQNNGICIDLYNGYECSCKFPYSGVHCDTHLCDCHICQNGATCVSYPDNYHCQCIPGFTGRTCENNINECIGNSCNKNGTLRCSDAVNNYTCICHGGFTGRHCQTHVCQKSNLCSNGSCIKLRDGYNCSCTKGFSGSNCETNIDDCTNVTCGRGTCVDGINHYTCLCPPLTTGRHCEISLDFCLSSPCLHNATCTNVLSNVSYSCKCQQPYVGTNCQYHICAVSNPCLHGTCVAFQRNFTCACFPGFTGPLCDQNIDECFSEPCLNGGLCMDGVNNFTCKCLKNHTGSNCESVIDFCSSLPCLNNGSCVNNYATLSYECHCSAPYSGRQCQFHQCDFTNPCKNNGTCLRDPTGVNCQCEPGYTSDDCSVEVNECESTPCLNHGTCTDLINGYSCNCSHNFTGAICEKPLTYCNTSSCVNGGTCFSNYIKKTFLCACSSYYTGERCEVSLGGPCHSRPCGINGVCKETSNNSYECTCNFGFHGRYCETFACPCDNGRCVKYTDSSSYHCVCITGFVGRYCETFYGDCRNITNTSLRCVDPSFCQETEFGFNCHCPPHLQDKQCETAGGCRNSTCLNGGNCTGEGDNYKCNCLAGFTGTLCEHDINECFLLPCLNNGSCAENDLNSYKCYCSSESSGLNCEHKNGTVRMSATEVEQTESYVLSKLTSLLKTNDLTKSLGMLTSTIIPHFNFMTGETESMLFTNTRSPINSATWTQPRSYIFPTSVTSRTFDTSLNIVSRYTLHTQKSSVLRETRTKIKLTSGISHSLSDISIIATPALSAQTSKYTSKMPSKHTSMKFKTSATMFRSVLTSNKIMGSTTYMKSYSVDTKVSTAIKRLYSNFTLTTEVSSTIWTNRSTSSATTTPSFGSQYRTHFTNAVSPSTNTFLDGTSTALESKGTVISGSTSLYSTSQSTIVVSDNLNTMILPSTSQKKHTFIFSNTSALYFSTSSTVPTHTTEPITVPTTTQRPFVNLKCADDPCNGFDCINETDNGLHFRCVCPFPSVGPRCILGSPLHFARFNGHAFIELPSIPMNISTNTILMSFHTLSPNGLLLYTNHTKHKDFIKISIVDGFLEYSFSTGAESVSIQSTEAVNTGHIVLFTASYNTSTGTGTLSISGVETISKSLQSSLRHIGITSTWYIGGLRVGGKIKSNFTGCIKDFQVNSKPFTITDASEVVDWVSISECDIPACNRGACYNNATCIKDIYDLNRFECHCQPGYFGDNCRQRTDHCSGDPCNGGLCVWTANGRQCLCHYGRVGSTCLIDTVISVPQYSQFQNYSSYTEYPWSLTGRHATERFEIRLQFKVVATTYDELQDGLMVYLGQNDIGSVNDDFFAVGISAGYVVLIFNLGSGNTLLRSGEQISLNRKWHFLVAGRTRQHGYLYMNSHDKVTKVTPGPLTGLNAYTPLYIGGVPNYNQLPPDLYAYFTTGFIGTIYDASIRTSDSSFIPLLTLMKSQVAASVIGIPVDGGLNVNNDGDNQCSRNPCANNGTCSSIGAGFTCHCQPPYKGNLCHDKELPCIDYNPCHPGSSCRADGFVIQCDCPLGWRGFFCTEQFNISQPYFKENSFLALPSLRVRTEFAMLIRFKADADNGLLFYASRNIQSTKGDFMAISLWQKYVYVRFNLGYVTTSMRTHTKISIGTWHSLYVRRVSRDAIMRLDNNAYVGVRSKGSMSMLDVGSMFYLGGVPYLSSINTAAVKDVRSQSDFIGCISAFMVNSYEFNLSVSSSSNMIGRNIGDCGSSCNKHQCKNNALCVPMNSTTYKCECSLGFIGDECGQAPQAFTLASFSSTSYWFTRASLLSSSTNGQYDLLFKSNRDGIIFWHGKLRGVKSDHVIVSIVDGNVHLRVSMGGQAAFSMINQSNFNDNNFHKLRINRIGNIIQFIVNGHTPKIVLINTVKSSLDNDGYFYLGGLPGEVAELSVGRYNAGFHGCIANVTLTGYDGFVNFASTDDARGKNVEPCV